MSAFLLSMLSLPSKSCRIYSAEWISECARGSLRVFHTDDNRQIVQWVGPDATKFELPHLDSKRKTLLSLRVVPTRILQVRKLAQQVPIAHLILAGVDAADEDIDFIVHSCHELKTLLLWHPSNLAADELNDLANGERALLGSKTFSGKSLAQIGELKDLTMLTIAGYRLPPSRLEFLSGLTNLEALSITDANIADDDLRHIGGLPKLKYLDLSGTSITGSGLCHLRKCPTLKCITLNRTAVTDELAVHLKDNPLRELRRIGVYGCRLSSVAVSSLQRQYPFTEIVTKDPTSWNTLPVPNSQNAQKTRLCRTAWELLSRTDSVRFAFESNRLTGAELRSKRQKWTGDWVFYDLASVTEIKRLSLQDCKFSSKAFGQLQALDRLEEVYLKNSSIDDSTMPHIALLQHLKMVELNGTKVTDAGLASLGKIRDLEELLLDDTPISDQGLAAIPSLDRLCFLSLKNCHITDAGARKLSGMKSLETLALDGTDITDSGVGYLARLPRLRVLNVIDCEIGDAGAAKLLGIPTLAGLNVDGTLISEEMFDRLKKHVLDSVAKSRDRRATTSTSDEIFPQELWLEIR